MTWGRRTGPSYRFAVLTGCFLSASSIVFPLPVLGQRPSAERIRHMVDTSAAESVALFREYLTLPNDAHHPQDIRRLADWVTKAFQIRGFDVERLSTPGSPLLLADRRSGSADVTILVYLQADGQPVDPSAWVHSGPYQPVLVESKGEGAEVIPWSRVSGQRDTWDDDWRIYARSASDSKGPNIQFLRAIDLLDVAGVTLDYHLKVIVDLEEEMGSPHLADAVERNRDRLAADALVIFDGPPHASGQPTLKFGARGISTFTLTTHGPRVPQHSGHYGNYAPNPALRLSRLLASMKDPQGRVTIPGWYDGIELDRATREALDRVPDDDAAIQRLLGIAETDAVGNSLQEAVQYPSLNIRGMSSGWVGEQARTIVPATATAEVDVRLVKESDPDRLLGLVKTFVESQGYLVLDRHPNDEERLKYARIATFEGRTSYGAFRTEFDAPPGRWLAAGMTHLFGAPPVLIRTSGGSIPIAPFVETLALPAVTVPTVNPDNNQHSPNENIRLGSFLQGIGIVAAVLSEPAGRFFGKPVSEPEGGDPQ